MLLIHNMQAREQEKERDREDRRSRAIEEKEDKERKDRNERDEKEREKEDKERKDRNERDERERRDLLWARILGQGQGQDPGRQKKEIKVVYKPEGSQSQPLPIKLVLSSLVDLKRFRIFCYN